MTAQYRKLKVSVYTSREEFLGDRLFQSSPLKINQGDNNHWLVPFQRLRTSPHLADYSFHTHDVVSPEQADFVLCLDMPKNLADLRQLRQRVGKRPLIALIIESPLFREYVFNSANHDMLDGILTYDHHRSGQPKYFVCKLSNDLQASIPEGPTFNDRRVASLVSTHQQVRFRRRFGIWRQKRAQGWKFTPMQSTRTLFASGELYAARHRLVEAANKIGTGLIDVYGRGWDGIRGWQGPLQGNKIGTLAKYRFNICFENSRNHYGYISEKIFDAFLAGTVPVYLGDDEVNDFVDPSAFVDARLFRSNQELLNFLVDMQDDAWQQYRLAGRMYLSSRKAKMFDSEGFAESIAGCLRSLRK